MFILFRTILIISLYLFISSTYAFSDDIPTFYADDVIITASRHLELASESPFSVTVITSEEIKLSGCKNVGDILKNRLGIYTKTKGYLGSEYSVSMRGSSYQQVLVLIDGIRINSPLLGGVDAGDLSLNNAERIEIVRGPLSSMYGADAVGGVVNIISKSPKAGQIFDIDTKIMEKGIANLDLSLFGGNDSIGYYLVFGHGESPGYRNNSQYYTNNVSSKINMDLFEGRTEILYKLYNANKGIPGSTVYPYASAWQKDNNDDLILSWHRDLGENIIQAKTFYIQRLQGINLDPSSSPDEHYDSFSRGIEIQGNINDLNEHIITTGISLQNDGCDSTYAGVNSIMNGSFFIEDAYSPDERTKIDYGARIDSYSVFGANVNPRIGLLHEVNPQVRFRSAYGESFRAPTLNDLFWYSVDPVYGTIMQGNINLKPEKSRNIELGLEYRATESLKIGTSIYSNNIKDLIQWVDISGTWSTWEAQNIGRAEITGLELAIEHSIGSNWKVSGNYTFQQALNSDTNKYLTYKPKDQYNIIFNYLDSNGNSVSCDIRYVGQRFDDDANTKKVEAYSVLGIRYDKTVNDISLYFGAENLFNQLYEDTMNYPMPGRIYYFGIKYKG